MPVSLQQRKVLDYKRCYELRSKERVSIYNIPEILAREGIVNSRKGKNLTPQAVWRASWIYALENIAEAKKDDEAHFRQYGVVFDESAWYKEMIGKAQQLFSRRKFHQYMNSHSYLKAYE